MEKEEVYITLETLFKNCKKVIYVFMHSGVYLLFEHNEAGLKKVVNFVRTDKLTHLPS
jgi:hypothetical protein